MAMRVSGINSGLDTDAIVQELVSAYSKKTEKYEKEQTKLGWKQDIWKSLNSKVYGLYTKMSNMRFSSAYAIKTVNSSDTTKATVSANGNAVNGTHKLNVLKTAQSAYLTSGKVTSVSGKVTSETKLSELGFNQKANLRVKTKDENGNWVNTDLKFDGDSTIADVTRQLQGAGLNASFDDTHGRFYISSKASGTNSDFEVTVADTTKVPQENPDGSFVKDPETGDVIFTEVTASNADILSSNRLLSALGLGSGKAISGDKIEKAATDGVKTKMTNLVSTWGPVSFEMRVTKTDGDGNQSTINKFIQFDTSKGDSIEDVINQMRKETGVDVDYDAATGKLVFQGADKVEFGADAVAGSQEAIDALGLGGTLTEETFKDKTPIKMAGQDAVIFLDGVRYTSDSNDFSINGLNITAQGVTDVVTDPDDTTIDPTTLSNGVTITTNTDSQGLYDTIKNFLTEYNNIINELTKLYNAESARGYDPLTDEEKDAMSDTEISKWETKIKDSLLRRDSSLDAIMSAMINSMNTGIKIGDKTYSLTTFGIHTMGFLNAVENEHNAFHIDGDEEDENTAGNDDELMKAIKNDPDTVIEFMKQLSTNLYNAIDKQMQGNSLRTKYKIYNDKEMDIQYKNYTNTIKEWEKKVSAKEDYYYKKFAAMETALAKLNSQQSSLAGLLGN